MGGHGTGIINVGIVIIDFGIVSDTETTEDQHAVIHQGGGGHALNAFGQFDNAAGFNQAEIGNFTKHDFGFHQLVGIPGNGFG